MKKGGHTELVSTDDQDGLVDLESEHLRLDKAEGLAVDLDESFAGLLFSNQYCFPFARPVVSFIRAQRTLQWATAKHFVSH